jgi:hypothetical protein
VVTQARCRIFSYGMRPLVNGTIKLTQTRLMKCSVGTLGVGSQSINQVMDTEGDLNASIVGMLQYLHTHF